MHRALLAIGIHPTVIRQVYSLEPSPAWTVEHAICAYLDINRLLSPALRSTTRTQVGPIIRSLGSCRVADLDAETLHDWFIDLVRVSAQRQLLVPTGDNDNSP